MTKSAYNRCAEDIALLHLLHKIPELPSVNKEPWITHDASRYALPFETERSLAGALAFISSITDNPNCITAVCVKEHPGAEALEVDVAINKQSYKDNNEVLETICRGFNSIFVRLGDPDGSCESDIFKQVISMCRARILCRLGYQKKTNYSKCRTPLDAVLDQARRLLLQLQSGAPVATKPNHQQRVSTMKAQIGQFLDGSAKLLKILRSWNLHQTDGELCAVIDGLWAFVAIEGWRAVVELIPDSLMNPTSRHSLTTMLRKGARYRNAARALYRAAKKHPVARRMEAVAVHLPSSAFQRPPPPSSPTSLDGTTSRIFAGQKKQHDIVGRMCRALKTDPAAARAAFAAQARNTLADGKFHAEVQLLSAILESGPCATPRVVCASKDACYLCHCLLRAHAQLHTPRCHGRLYPGWRLPATPAFRPLQAALSKTLEQKIRDGAGALLSADGGRRRARRVHPYPCESTCSTAVLSDTTIAVAEPLPVDAGVPPSENRSDATIAEKSPTPLEPSPLSSTMRDGNDQAVGSRASSLRSRSWSIGESYALAQGQVVAASLPAATSVMYTADALRVQLEYTARRHSGSGVDASRRLEYRIQQLTSREAEILREGSYTSIVDATSLATTEDRTYKLHELADLYLGAGDCIFRLTLQPTRQP